MVYVQRPTLSSFIRDLQSGGRAVFQASEAEESLGVNHGAFLDAAARLQKKQLLVHPRRGFYVVVPPEYDSWGAPPPSWYIDDLMRYEEAPYYVAHLKAAAMHGASHQAVMEFQVVTGKRIPMIRAGRNRIGFYYRKDMKAISQGLVKRNTDTGTMNVSSPALTALDVLRYPHASAGIDNVATVLSEMGPEIKPRQLAELSNHFERPVVQRLGCLLDQVGHGSRAARMYAALNKRGVLSWTELVRGEIYDPDLTPEPVLRDERWRVVVRRILEPDV